MPHYPMRIQPVDFNAPPEPQPKPEAATRPVLKLRFKRLFERPFSSVLRTSAPEKPSEEFEPSSVCLGKMVQNFIEGNNDKPTQSCGRRNCNCDCKENSDEEPHNSSSAIDALKNLVPCSSVSEMNLVADVTEIIQKNKDKLCRKKVADGLTALGFKASICKSKWEKTSSSLAGEYEYVDVMIKGERLIIDVDFRSEFIIATPTKAYQLVLRTLPDIFVGKASRLEKIITIVSDAAKQSLKKKGMPFPPWRKAGYVKAKWLSPFTRIGPTNLVFGDAKSCLNDDSKCDGLIRSMKNWEPFEFRPKSVKKGVRIVTGLASIMEDKA